jgi:nitrogen fixation protein FixH
MKSIIIFAVITAVLAVGGSIYVGVRTFDDTVTENPYEEGLAWDDMHRKKESLGWQVRIENSTLVTGDNDMVISVKDKYGKPLADAGISLIMSRPGTSENDKYFYNVKFKDGLYRSSVNFPLYGYWSVRIEISQEGERIPYEKRIYVEKGG